MLVGEPFDVQNSYIREMDRRQKLVLKQAVEEDKKFKKRLLEERDEHKRRLDMLFGRRA